LHFDKPRPEEIKSGAMNLDLNKLMQNVGAEEFHYDTFKAAYDTDPRIKALIANFSERGIEPKTKKAPSDMPQGDRTGSDASVGAMAKRATKLGDKL
jgi:hypothetical protein